jgi:hypothetical protein
MSNENQDAFKNATADIAAMVQADVDQRAQAGGSTPPVQQTTQQPTADPTVRSAAPNQAPPEGKPSDLILGKFKSMDEATKAHHLLIHNLNSIKAENDALKAAQTAAPAAPAPPAPLSPGRVDPSADDGKWREQYGIDPADLDARIEARVQARLEAERGPQRALRAAETYIVQQYPDFSAKVEDIKAFVGANAAVNARVQDLYSMGLYAEAMEIGYLSYDNALRTFQVAAADHANTQGTIDADRQAGSMITSQGGGPREAIPQTGGFPQTKEQWEEIAMLKANGQDAEVRRRLYGHMIAGIPALNGGRTR